MGIKSNKDKKINTDSIIVYPMNSLKEKIRRRETILGSWITIGNPYIAEIMAKSGFDFLTIDMEHSAITISEAQQLIQVIDLCGCSPLVRVTNNDPNKIKRVMDAGACGVIVPMVNSKGDAEKAVKAVRYPPNGNRGVGLARAQGYGLSFEAYKEWLEENSVVIAQIEHIDAVNNLEEIMTTDGIDGMIIGPYDLSGSLMVPGDFENEDVKEALERVESICNENDYLMGFHVVPPDPEMVVDKIRLGYRFLAYSLDELFLASVCMNDLDQIKKNING